MKTKYKDQLSLNTINIGTANGTFEFPIEDFPNLDPDDAFLPKKISLALSSNSRNIGTPPCESTPVDYDVTFNWALNGRLLISGVDLISQKTLLAYSGRSGGIIMPSTAGLRSTFMIGSEKDQANFEAPDGLNVLSIFPVRKMYLDVQLYDVAPGSGTYELNVRVKYDTVTLTTSEQADLYQLLGY